MLLCGCLLLISVTIRVVALYKPQYSNNPDLLYPLEMLPELLDMLILCIPRLMARIALGPVYTKWQAAALGGASGASKDAEAAADDGKASLDGSAGRGAAEAEFV